MREVESRAAEIQRIEETLTGLAQLFNDVSTRSRRGDEVLTILIRQMATLVEAQDVQIVNVEQTAVTAAQDIEKGLDETKQAVVSARGARAKRWWCFGILMVILVSPPLVSYIPRPHRVASRSSSSSLYSSRSSSP